MTDHNQPQYGPPQGQPQYGAPQYGQQDQGNYPQGQSQYGAPQYGAPQYGQQDQMGGQGGPGYYQPAVAARPPAMDKAVLMMKIGAVLSVITGLLAFAMRGTIHDAVQNSVRDQSQGLTPDQIDMAVNMSVGMSAVFGLLGALLWWWMAVANGQGKSWARMTATVFFVISLIFFAMSFAQPSGGALSLILNVLHFLIGAAAIFFMYQKESSRFYEERSRKI